MNFLKDQKLKIALALSFVVVAIFLLPSLTSAAGIVPTSCDGPDCGFNNLLELAKNIMNFIIAVSIPLAAVAFAYAGYLMITAGGNEGQVSQAREIFTKVLIGFVFVLGAWLIVWTITTTLLCDPSTSSSCGFLNLLSR